MVVANIVEDIIKVVDENPLALEALRSRLLTRELLETPTRLAQFAESHARFEETSQQFMATTHQFMVATNERLDRLETTLERFMAATNERLDRLETTLERFMATTQQFMATTQQFMVTANKRLDNLESLVRSIHHDVGVFKGHYARDMAEALAFTIADEHGFAFKRVLSKSEVAAMIQASDTSGISRDDLRSFSVGDAIMLVTDADGADCYIAAEASYTVHWGDVERAIRNAEFVARFTGRPAHPLVAGVVVNERVRMFAIETGKALWSRLPDRLVQAD